MNAQIQTLKADIKADLQAIAEIYSALHRYNVSPLDDEQVIIVAYYLHNLYSAFESIFQRIATVFENQISDQAGWHVELLRHFAVDILSTADRRPQLAISNSQFPIPTVLLKGAALAATLYPSIGLRPMGDLDLLVPEDRLTEAVARLKALGYVEPHQEMAVGLNALVCHEVHLQGGQDVHLAVELHWTLVGGPHDWRAPSLPWFWTQTEEWKMENGGWKREDGAQLPTSNLQSPISNLQSAIRNSQFLLPPPTSSISAPT